VVKLQSVRTHQRVNFLFAIFLTICLTYFTHYHKSCSVVVHSASYTDPFEKTIPYCTITTCTTVTYTFLLFLLRLLAQVYMLLLLLMQSSGKLPVCSNLMMNNNTRQVRSIGTLDSNLFTKDAVPPLAMTGKR